MTAYNKRLCLLPIIMLFFSGCNQNKLPPMQQLPPPQTYPADETTQYTGTTVDFYYMETTTEPATRGYGIEMPEMPEFPTGMGVDDPFGEDFKAVFENNSFPTLQPETSAVTSETTAPESTAEDETAAASESASDTQTSDNYIFAEIPAFDTPETTYNISDYVPDNIFIME